MFRSWYAIGIGTGFGLVLVCSNSANAQQPETRHYQARTAFHHHVANHRHAATKKDKEKDSKALTFLKMMGWTAPALRHQGAITWSSLNATTRGAIHHAG
jgi:hypothetical protein